MEPTKEQRDAALAAANLTTQQQAGVAAGAGYPTTSPPPIAVGAIATPESPLKIATKSDVPIPDIKNVAADVPKIETPSTPFLGELEKLSSSLKGKDSDIASNVSLATAPIEKQLNDINQQIKMHQATSLERQEKAREMGETLGFADAEAQKIARTDAIETLKLAAIQAGLQGNLALAEKHATNAVNAKYGQIEKDVETARNNILANWDSFSDKEKERAKATLLRLDKEDAFIKENKEKDTKIQSIALEAGKNGADATTINQILGADSVESAMGMSQGYLAAPQTETVELANGAKILIDKRTGKTIKVLGGGSTPGGNLPVNATDTQKSLADAFGFISGRMTSDERKANTSYFNKLIAEGNDTKAREFIVSTALANAPTDQQNKTIGRFEALAALKEISEGLAELDAKGEDTGFIKGNMESIANRIGKTTDEDLKKIQNKIRIGIIDYRKAVSGAAFTESEKAEYERVFPSIGNVREVNTANIETLEQTFNRNNRVLMESMIGPGNYDALFSKPAPAADTTKSAEKDEDVFNEVAGIKSVGNYFGNLQKALLGQ